MDRGEEVFAVIKNTILCIGVSFIDQLFTPPPLFPPPSDVIVIKDFITIVFYTKNYPGDKISLFYSLFPMECEIWPFLHRAPRATLMANEPGDVPD